MDNIILNINSLNADLSKYTSSNFVYYLEEEFKNIIYIKLGSIELPTSNYNFLERNKNTNFIIISGVNRDEVKIDEGNYTTDTIIIKIQEKLDQISSSRGQSYFVDLDINSGKIYFTNSSEFTLEFPKNNTQYKTLGQHLGFKEIEYTGTTIYGVQVINLNSPNYYFLKINNLDNVKDYKAKNVFAKIIQNTGSFDFLNEGKSDFVSKDMVFRSPINLSKLEIQVVDYLGNIVDLNGFELSLTLELGQIYDKSLYDKINNKGIPNGDHRLKFFY
tara:strand:- start:6418 stop:7239 length:822 start_codon:yes stop_codon:yes gene_type:complete